MKAYNLHLIENSFQPLRNRSSLLRGAATAVPALGLLFAPVPASAQTFTAQTILATANIYGAGRTGAAATPAPSGGAGGGGNAGGSVASPFNLNTGTNRILTFSSVTGTTTFDSVNSEGPDGAGQNSQVQAFQGISGISFTTGHGQLVGVFINGAPAGFADGSSGSNAATLSYDTAAQALATYSPVLNQTFFIGDGLTGTGSGAVQQFFVPTGATQLVLGFSDGQSFSGNPPGAYNDNTGALTASFAVSGSAAAGPEPGSIALLVLSGLPAAGVVARRRRKAA